MKNFRCYTNQTFEFDNDTITLINGPSGHGKTTILTAIQFAIYGATNHKYLITHNKSSCEVVLEYKNFKIKRTKRPNILNVEFNGRFYEDKEAQIILNKYFGTSYSSFFLDLSHLEKMEFLEKITNADCDVKNLKLRLKDEISTLNKELAILDGQISNTENMLDIVQKPDKVVKPQIEDYFKGQTEDNFNEENNLSTLTKDELYTNQEKVRERLEKTMVDVDHLNKLKVEIDVLQKEIESLGDVNHNILQELGYSKKQLVKLKVDDDYHIQQKEKFLIVQESIKELEQYQNFKEEDLHTFQQQIELVGAQIENHCIKEEFRTFKKRECEYKDLESQEKFEWQEKVNALQNNITALNQGNVTSLNLKELEQQVFRFEEAQTFNVKYNLSQIKDEIQSLKLQFLKTYICGHCSHKIVINMDTFEQVEDHFMEQISTNPKKICNATTLKNKIQKLEVLKDKIQHNEEYIQSFDIENLKEQINHIKTLNQLKNNLDKLGAFKPSIHLSKMEKELAKQRAKITFVEDENNDEELIDINTLKDDKRDLMMKYSQLSDKLKIKANLTKRIADSEPYDVSEHNYIKQQIEACNELLKLQIVQEQIFKNKERLEGKLVLLKRDMEQLQDCCTIVPQLKEMLNCIEKGIEYHKKYDKYRNFQLQLQKYKKVKSTLKNFKEEKEKVEQMYLKTLLFKQKVIEAEHESLEFIINIINSHLAILLQDFFSESFGDPIQIYLELVSDKRPQVNTIINYRGNKVDYKSLSTGEYARVKLAFDLTFKEILGEDIIMLDECTANLDQDLSTKIFNKIKSTFPSKTILVVAHQVVTGTFDHILSL